MSLPPSSPRLPSPPPPTEIQIGTQSPGPGSSSQESTIEQSVIDANSSRRIHPGTKAADMAAGPPLIPLGELDSAFQLQEHLKALHYHYTKDPESEDTIAITRETALSIATPPDGVDRYLWLYELCRFLINKCNDLIIGFLFDDPPCSATTCPEMRASEWQFLCAVHESPKSCCAIDYCCHTLDWATNIVTSQNIFPSRLSLGPGNGVDDMGPGIKHLVNIFRRLHRIFAHAWFQHREVFWRVEGQTGLYVLFKMVCDSYQLLPAENYKLPPEAEGLESAEDAKAAAPSILKADPGSSKGLEEGFLRIDGLGSVGRTNTRRHIRQSPSVGSAVTTVLESEDEEEPAVTQKLEDLHIVEEEDDVAEIPVIVESDEIGEEKEVDVPEVDPVPDEDTKFDSVIKLATADSSPPNSTTSSWDRMSSDSLEEKSDDTSGDETAPDEPLAEAKPLEPDVEETRDTEESKSHENTHAKAATEIVPVEKDKLNELVAGFQEQKDEEAQGPKKLDVAEAAADIKAEDKS